MIPSSGGVNHTPMLHQLLQCYEVSNVADSAETTSCLFLQPHSLWLVSDVILGHDDTIVVVDLYNR